MVSVGRLLAQLELTFQKPLFRGLPAGRFPRRALVEAGIPEDPRLGEEGKRRDFFEDESGVRPDFYRGTAWAAKGKTPRCASEDNASPSTYFRRSAPRGALRFMMVRVGVGASVFIEFLKHLMQGQRRKVFLIVDGHPSHRAKKVKTSVESLKGKLQSFFLPPYFPELNPDELA